MDTTIIYEVEIEHYKVLKGGLVCIFRYVQKLGLYSNKEAARKAIVSYEDRILEAFIKDIDISDFHHEETVIDGIPNVEFDRISSDYKECINGFVFSTMLRE